jgi:hypothetical protein
VIGRRGRLRVQMIGYPRATNYVLGAVPSAFLRAFPSNASAAAANAFDKRGIGALRSRGY